MTNDKENILAIHDALYEYLIGLHNVDESFRFRIRPKDDKYFNEGYWFHFNRSNNGYLHISFWTSYNEKLIQRIRLYLPINSQKKAYCDLDVYGDINSEIINYFKIMATYLDFNVGEKSHSWYKPIKQTSNLIVTIVSFIENEKKAIDKYIRDNPYDGFVDFIKDDEFKRDYSRVEKIRSIVITDEIQKQRDFILEEARLCLISKPTLPNALSRISISNFQGIRELVIENIPLSTNWIFLTGENGFGKTSILRAIAKGFVGDESYVSPMPEESLILLNAMVNGASFKRNSQEKKANMTVPLVVYGVSRFGLATGDQAASDRSKQKTYSLFHDDGLLYNIEQVLINYYAYDKNRFEMLKKVFLKLIPNLKDITIKATNGNPKVIYSEKDEMGNAYEPISLNDLAAGYRSIFTMVGDMIIRLSEGFDNDTLEDLSGIVLIDEIDAHLHPKYQYELPKLLSDIFPKIQFIVTTHSPIPILGLPKENHPVILTVERNAENGISIDRKDDDFDFRQLSTEALLTSPVFGFQTLFARGTTADEIIPTSDFKEVLEIEAIKERLKKLRAEGLVQ